MDNRVLELAANCSLENRAKLMELYVEWDYTTLGETLQEQRFNEIADSVLSENKFFAEIDAPEFNLPKGTRVTDNRFTFLLSMEDFKLFTSMLVSRAAEQGLCKEDGAYLTPWTEMKVKARGALLDFIIEKIIPESMRESFRSYRHDYKIMESLLDATRVLIGPGLS